MLSDNANNVQEKAKPPVKWAGGKSQLIEQFRPLFPRHFKKYLEPFVGGGAVFFELQPQEAVLIDSNPELINFYTVVRDHLEALLADLARHENTAEYYYHIRSLDPDHMDPVGRASRFLYLNKTAYNGLWRVNRKGQHNVPYGRYKNPQYRDEENLKRVSKALRSAELLCADFTEVLKYAEKGDFIYLDPPYHPLNKTANFTSYTSDAFTEADQERLAETFRVLDARDCKVMLSNSDTEFIRDLYRDYRITTVTARRAINCRADRRGPISELVVRNYK